jgi:hypothetical protein
LTNSQPYDIIDLSKEKRRNKKMTEEYLKKEITRLKKEIEKQPMSANEKRIRNCRKAWIEYYENELKKIKGVDK